MTTSKSDPEKTDTNHFDRRPFQQGKKLRVVEPIKPEEVQESFETFGEDFCEGTITDTQAKLLRVLSKQDPELASHLYDVGVISEAILTNKQFKRGFLNIIRDYYGASRLPEAKQLFEVEMMSRIKQGVELHDIGKTALAINTAIHKAGKPTAEELATIQSHTGVELVLEALGVQDPIIRQIALYHHAPNYYGGNPYGKNNQIYDTDISTEHAHMQLPFHVCIAKWIDILHAMIESRPYRNRGMIWWENARKQLPPQHELKERFTIERELRDKSPEDQSRGGHLVTLFLKTMQELWEDHIDPKLTSTRIPIIITPDLPKGYLHETDPQTSQESNR